ncbi:MAG: rRNA maturation RNase YbeY [Acidobacteriota bacterium]
MILLDPDLAPISTAAAEPNDRLPTAQALTRFLKTAQDEVRLRGAVSVLLTTDAAIKRLNKTFRGKNKATDVLSFPAARQARGEVAGDLAISAETARKQATEQGHTVVSEIKILMLHGLLHLAGYDHETDDGRMARRERALRKKLALPLGLIERSAPQAQHGVKKAPAKQPSRGQMTRSAGKTRPKTAAKRSRKP